MKKKPVLLPFGKTIFQLDAGQSISSDTSFLTGTVLSNCEFTKQNVLEMGSGNGIISIMISHFRPKWEILGIEIQPELTELSLQNNKLAGTKADFFIADLRGFTASEQFDIIISNPPYFRQNEGKLSPQKIRAISRYELKCKMSDVLTAIKRNLHNNGKAFVMYPESRSEELKKKAKKVDLKIIQKFLFTGSKVIIFLIKKG